MGDCGVSRYFTLYTGGVKPSTFSLCRLVAASSRAAGQRAGGNDLSAEQSCVAPQRAQGSSGCARTPTSACYRDDCGAHCGRPPPTAAAARKYAAQRQVAPAFVGGAMDMLVLWLGPCRGPRLLPLVQQGRPAGAQGAPWRRTPAPTGHMAQSVAVGQCRLDPGQPSVCAVARMAGSTARLRQASK